MVLGSQKDRAMRRRLPKKQLPTDEMPQASWIVCWAPRWPYFIRSLGAMHCAAEGQIGQLPWHRAGRGCGGNRFRGAKGSGSGAKPDLD